MSRQCCHHRAERDVPYSQHWFHTRHLRPGTRGRGQVCQEDNLERCCCWLPTSPALVWRQVESQSVRHYTDCWLSTSHLLFSCLRWKEVARWSRSSPPLDSENITEGEDIIMFRIYSHWDWSSLHNLPGSTVPSTIETICYSTAVLTNRTTGIF